VKIGKVNKPIIKISTRENKAKFVIYYGRKIRKHCVESCNIVDSLVRQAAWMKKMYDGVKIYVNDREIFANSKP